MYCELQWFRDHGFAIGEYPDAMVTEAVREASLFVESFTGMWYEARERTLLLDGRGKALLHLYIPIVDISAASVINPITGAETAFTVATGLVIYNRQLPDDRPNPKIVSKSVAFAKGRQNISLTGRFGYVDSNPSYTAEEDVDPGEIGDVTFTGTGPDDLTVSGSYVGATDLSLVFWIDSVGAPDTYKWSKDGGLNWVATEVDITLDLVEVIDGIYIQFGGVTGHTENDKWEFTTKALDWLTPPDIVNVVRLLVIRRLRAPLEDEMAQAELDMMAKVKSERTDKHSITYRDVGIGDQGATGDINIDSILYKYKALRPKVGVWI